MSTKVRFRTRIYCDEVIAIGPGKVELLEAVATEGSISAAARKLGMSYRRAWLLLDAMNTVLKSPAVTTATGGSRGGGASITAVGVAIIKHYRALEAKAEQAASEDISALMQLLANTPARAGRN